MDGEFAETEVVALTATSDEQSREINLIVGRFESLNLILVALSSGELSAVASPPSDDIDSWVLNRMLRLFQDIVMFLLASRCNTDRR